MLMILNMCMVVKAENRFYLFTNNKGPFGPDGLRHPPPEFRIDFIIT